MDLFKNTAIKETESGPFRRHRRYIIRKKKKKRNLKRTKEKAS